MKHENIIKGMAYIYLSFLNPQYAAFQ